MKIKMINDKSSQKLRGSKTELFGIEVKTFKGI